MLLFWEDPAVKEIERLGWTVNIIFHQFVLLCSYIEWRTTFDTANNQQYSGVVGILHIHQPEIAHLHVSKSDSG